MALENPVNPQPETQQSLTEQQIRTLRSDLGSPVPPAEPTLTIPQNTPSTFDADEPAFSPNTMNQMGPSVDELIAAESKKKTLWWILGGAGGVIVLGLVGYFAIYPLLAKIDAAPDAAVVTPTTPTTPTTPSTPVEPLPPTTTPAHVSAFVNEPEARSIATVSLPLSRNAILEMLIKQAENAKPGMTELVVADSTGAPIPFGTFIAALTPGFTEVAKANLLFTDDFTAFILKDEKGSWPGYIANLKTGFVADELRSWFASLEKSPISNFFIVSPGTVAPFKDGTVNGKYADRYAPGSTPGASLGYLVLPTQGKMVISTSFTGLKEAIRLMGL